MEQLNNNIYEEAPEGWNTFRSLGFDQSKIQAIISGYRNSNPEYFKQLRGSSGQVEEYYSPELLRIIREKAEGK